MPEEWRLKHIQENLAVINDCPGVSEEKMLGISNARNFYSMLVLKRIRISLSHGNSHCRHHKKQKMDKCVDNVLQLA